IVVSKTNQEPPQDLDIHQLIEECCIEVPEQQKQNMEKTMLDLVKIYHHKQFLCIHDDVDDLIESALDSKLLSINSINSQHLDKKEQEVKIVEEQPAERRNRAKKSLQNFRVMHKSSISLNTSQISSIHSVAPILLTKELENSLSMGYEHLSITPETKSDEVTESNAKNLLPIPSKCEHSFSMGYEHFSTTLVTNEVVESSTKNLVPIPHESDVTSDNGNESIEPVKDDSSVFTTFSNPLIDNDKIYSDELNSHVESNFVESTSNHDIVKIDNLDEFSRPLIPIHK
nr:hypothetical protein [Tanacetum cinerariifolium]